MFTKILATIGPKTQPLDVMNTLLDAGVTAIRMNFSHGDHDYHRITIQHARTLGEQRHQYLPIVLDTKGPEIRTGMMVDDTPIELITGGIISVTTEAIAGTSQLISVSYPSLIRQLVPGDKIMIADGLIALEVEKKLNETTLQCKIMNGGKLGSRKNVNLPGIIVDLPALSDKDKDDLRFGCVEGVDFIAASFIRTADHVLQIRTFLDDAGGKHIKIIAKIENQQGIDHLDEILEVADGLMVARGDLGVDIPIESIPLVQKMMIQKANKAGKFAITATQMLESMITNPRPTRAEVTDIANAILDGTDVVMLSGETASGAYPLEAVSMMQSVCTLVDPEQTARHLHDDLAEIADHDVASDMTRAIARGAVQTARAIHARAIVVMSTAGTTVRQIRKYHPHCPVIMLTAQVNVARQSTLIRGVVPFLISADVSYADIEQIIQKDLVGAGYIALGDSIVLTGGGSIGSLGHTDMIKIIQL